MEKGSSSKSSRRSRRGEEQSSSFDPVLESVLRETVAQSNLERGLVDSSEASSSGRKGYLLRNPSRRSRKFYEDEVGGDEYDDDDDEEYGVVDRKGKKKKKKDQKRRNPSRRRQHNHNQNQRKSVLEARDGEMSNEQSQKTTILSWLIDTRTVELGEQVFYRGWSSSHKAVLVGRITRGGILCMCCCTVVTVMEFEAHAGWKSGTPFQHIYTDRHISLFECQLKAWNNMGASFYCNVPTVEYANDSSDDICGVCADGGNLLCCDGCPATYHPNCLGMEVVPPGSWYCPLCQCKYCGGDGSSSNCERVQCCQCEKKFHVECIRLEDSMSVGRDLTFCGQKCSLLFASLHNLIGLKNDTGQGITWSLYRSIDIDTASLYWLYKIMQWNAVLAATLSVMEECFAPIVDPRTGINLMRSIIFNRGFSRLTLNRLNFCGFYTAVLERNDEIISVATIRIHGTKLAEMPFIGTRTLYRHQGMCRRLLVATENVLHSLGVERLIIPSISERVDSWIRNYNFRHIEEPLQREMNAMNLLTFPKTVQLQKVLLEKTDDDTSANKTIIPGRVGCQVNDSRRTKAPHPFDLNLPPPDQTEVIDIVDNVLATKVPSIVKS